MSQLDSYINNWGKINGPVIFASKMQVARKGKHPDLDVSLADSARHRRLVAALPDDATARRGRKPFVGLPFEDL